MNEDRKARIAIIEDDPLVRDALAETIAAQDDLCLAGTAGSISEAAALMTAEADVVLLDLGLPDGSGMALIPHFRSAGDARIVILTSFGDRDTVLKAIEAGADGYLLKDSSEAEIVAAIGSALGGGAPISAAAAVHLLERLRARKPETSDAPALTGRETELLQIFAKGYSYKEAARIMVISPLTVGNHVRSIYRKLDVHTRGEAVYEAMRSGKLAME